MNPFHGFCQQNKSILKILTIQGSVCFCMKKITYTLLSCVKSIFLSVQNLLDMGKNRDKN